MSPPPVGGPPADSQSPSSRTTCLREEPWAKQWESRGGIEFAVKGLPPREGSGHQGTTWWGGGGVRPLLGSRHSAEMSYLEPSICPLRAPRLQEGRPADLEAPVHCGEAGAGGPSRTKPGPSTGPRAMLANARSWSWFRKQDSSLQSCQASVAPAASSLPNGPDVLQGGVGGGGDLGQPVC